MSGAAEALAGGSGGGEGPVARALGLLWVYVRRNVGYYVLCAVTILFYVACFVAIPVLVGDIMQAAVAGLARQEILRRCALLLGVALASALFRYVSRTLVFNAAREVEYEIRNDLFAHLQRLPQSFYFRWRTGDLMSRAVNDLNAVRMLLGPAMLNVLQTPVLFTAVIVTMFVKEPSLALLVLIPYPLFVLIARSFGTHLHARSLAVQVSLADMSSKVQETVSGMGVVKAYAMEDEQDRRFALSNDDLYRRQLALVRVNAAMPAITGLLPALGMGIVLLVGGPEIQRGRMTVAEFFTFAMFIYQLTFPTFIMGWVVALVQRGAAALQRIDEILSTPPSIADREDAAPLASLRGEIEFRHLSFRYADGRPALEDVSLRVPAGSSLGVVGPVGAGKSTLASLVPRLYEVEDGQLFLDGVDVNRIRLATLRSHIAMVPQDSFLFSMTLADNIAFGSSETERAEVEAAAERAQLAKDVPDLPQGYETLVGERGVMLSGGQRQRAALARALLMHPRILILDDTLSAVDAETEAAIQRGLAELQRGRTVIVVASRVSTVRDCDRIVVMDGGRVVEQGTHAELLARGGLYARLAREQAREAEQEVALA